jgi:hypothetical protein
VSFTAQPQYFIPLAEILLSMKETFWLKGFHSKSKLMKSLLYFLVRTDLAIGQKHAYICPRKGLETPFTHQSNEQQSVSAQRAKGFTTFKALRA